MPSGDAGCHGAGDARGSGGAAGWWVWCGVVRFEGDGAVAFDGAVVRVLDAAGAAAGTFAGGLAGTVTLDLATALFSMYYN